MEEIEIEGVKILYDAGDVRILDSHLVEDEKKMILVLLMFKKRTNYQSKRTYKSWLKEWKAHNRLYRLGLFKGHTTDCDLEENEKWWRLLAYQILGI